MGFSDYSQLLETLGYETSPWRRKDTSSALLFVGLRDSGQDSLTTGPSAELLDRMLSAIGLGRGSVEIHEVASKAEAHEIMTRTSARIIVAFNPIPAADTPSRVVVSTPSPAECLKDPNLKRVVWGDLQRIRELLR